MCRTRVMGDVTDRDNETTGGRGNLSFTTINLPRLGIKHGICLGEREEADWDGFYKELDKIIDAVRGQLLERFRIQCSKRNYHFPFLIKEGVWYGGDKLKANESLREILKHGTLTMGYIGLAECLVAMTGKHHGESKEAQKLGLEIIKHIREKCDEYSDKYQLNFSCIATPERICGQLMSNHK